MADLNRLPVEELAGMPDWLIPPSRKAEVEVFQARKARMRRESLGDIEGANQPEPKTKPGERMEDPRGYWEIRNKGSGGTGTSMPRTGTSIPEVKRGPRGGRYTEDQTKDGRPYRRYF